MSKDSQSQSTPAATTEKVNELGSSSKAANKSGVSTTGIIAHPEIPRITCQELKGLMDREAKIAIADARSTSAWESEHIPGSFCIPPTESSVDPDTRRDQIMAFAPNTLIVLYCDWADDGDAASLAVELLDLRYDKNLVKVLRGGFTDWKKLSYSVAKGYPGK
jgi:rhodanese-related sulfurtransferase